MSCLPYQWAATVSYGYGWFGVSCSLCLSIVIAVSRKVKFITDIMIVSRNISPEAWVS